MVIHLGSSKTMERQVGRNFVRPLKHAQSVHEVTDAWHEITRQAKRARSERRVKGLNEALAVELAEEKAKVKQSQDKVLQVSNFRVAQAKKIANFLLRELDLTPTKRTSLAELLEVDSKLYYVHSMLSNGRSLPRSELLAVLKQGLKRMGDLDPRVLVVTPVIGQNKKTIRQIIKLVESSGGKSILVDPSAVYTLKYVNDQLVKQLLGTQYNEYKSLTAKATKNLGSL